LLRVAAAAASLALHVGIFGALALARASAVSIRRPTAIDFQVVAPPVAPAPVAPPPAPTAAVRTAAVRAAPAVPDPPALAGVTLTAQGPSEPLASVVGNGERMEGPLPAPPVAPAVAAAPAPVRPAARPPEVHPPEIVKLADLSRPPRPPSLATTLAAHYPPDARRSGLEGEAKVSAIIGPDGRVRSARVVAESGAGFGAACERTLLGSVWSPPLGRDGRAVSTKIRYTCRFRVDR
jgi:TonB family protein